MRRNEAAGRRPVLLWFGAMRRGLALTLLSLLTGCFYPADRGKLMEARVDRLESSWKETETELTRQRERISAQLAETQSTLEKLDRAARRTGADMGVQLEQLQAEVSLLRGQVEQYLHKIAELENDLAMVKDSQAKATSAAAAAVAAKEEAKKKELERPADKKAFAELVSEKLKNDREVGRKLAAEWLKKYPKEPLAAKVFYDLGMSYVDEKDYRAALGEFKEIIENFAKTDHAPLALLRSSECFGALKMADEQRMFLEEIINSYPKSDLVKEAKEKLAALKKKPAPAPSGKKK